MDEIVPSPDGVGTDGDTVNDAVDPVVSTDFEALLGQAQERILMLEAEISELKANNYELVMSGNPDNSGGDDNAEGEDEDDYSELTIDDLFGEKDED